MAVRIHPRAEVDTAADLGDGVEVGPFAVVEGGVRVGEGCRILAGAHLRRGTTLGRENVVRDHAVLGGDPQDLSYGGAETFLRVGDRNTFGEGCTLHRGSKAGGTTVIGNDCFFMANTHAGHDSRVADHVILANGALLGGHAQIGERAFLSGNAVVHQHCRVGRLVMLRGTGAASKDIPPFSVVSETNRLRGLNGIGLQRAGIGGEDLRALRRAYRTLFARPRNLRKAIAEVEAHGPLTAEVQELLDFIAASERGVAGVPRRGE